MLSNFKYIDKVGCELEGAFLNIPDPDNKFLDHVKGEGMSISPEERAIINEKKLVVGERNSEPYKALLPLRKWVRKFWPEVVNNSNGFHVHVSFKDPSVRSTIVASADFHRTFIEECKKFVLSPKYRFSKSVIDRAAHNIYGHHYHSTGDRRSGVTPFADYDTSEFRIFSGDMTAKQANLCLTWLVSFIENYFEEHEQATVCDKARVVYHSFSGQQI